MAFAYMPIIIKIYLYLLRKFVDTLRIKNERTPDFSDALSTFLIDLYINIDSFIAYYNMNKRTALRTFYYTVKPCLCLY